MLTSCREEQLYSGGEIISAKDDTNVATTPFVEIIAVRIVKVSARNILKGKVKRLVNGPVNTEVTVRLSGGEEVVSTMTRASAEELELKEGKEV